MGTHARDVLELAMSFMRTSKLVIRRGYVWSATTRQRKQFKIYHVVQEEIESLKAENTGVKEEIGELKALVTSLHAALTTVENRLKSVSSRVDLLQSVHAEEVSPSQLEPTPPEQAPRSSYSDVTRSNTTNERGSANQGHTRRRGTGRRDPPSRPDRGDRQQARPPSNQAGLPNSTSTSTVATSPNGGEKIPACSGEKKSMGYPKSM